VAQSTTAGVITAFGVLALLMTAMAGLITAFAARRTSKRVEVKVDLGNEQGRVTHELVNQRFTDMENWNIALQQTILDLGGTVPKDQSKGKATQ
jgi:hypothetical protein